MRSSPGLDLEVSPPPAAGPPTSSLQFKPLGPRPWPASRAEANLTQSWYQLAFRRLADEPAAFKSHFAPTWEVQTCGAGRDQGPESGLFLLRHLPGPHTTWYWRPLRCWMGWSGDEKGKKDQRKHKPFFRRFSQNLPTEYVIDFTQSFKVQISTEILL